MKLTRLRIFIVISVIFHVVIISAVVLLLITGDRDQKPDHIEIPFGLISQDGESTSLSNEIANPVKAKPLKLKDLKSKEQSVGERFSSSMSLDSGALANKKLETAKLDGSVNNIMIEKKENKNVDFGRKRSDETNKDSDERSSITTRNSQTEINSTDEKLSNIDNNSKQISGGEIASNPSTQNLNVAYPDYKVNPKPTYPMIARRRGYEGSVHVRVWVLESGSVGKIELEKSSGYRILDESALKAVKDWVFVPGEKNGYPISSWVTVPIKFQLKSG